MHFRTITTIDSFLFLLHSANDNDKDHKDLLPPRIIEDSSFSFAKSIKMKGSHAFVAL